VDSTEEGHREIIRGKVRKKRKRKEITIIIEGRRGAKLGKKQKMRGVGCGRQIEENEKSYRQSRIEESRNRESRKAST
jgi:hypothetical protein